MKLTKLFKENPEEYPNPGNFYSKEIDEVIGNMEGTTTGYPRRQRFIAKLTSRLEGNTLVLFRYRRHGNDLFEAINKHTNRKTFFIDGTVDTQVREDIRNLLEVEDDIIVVASYATLSTGINVRNLHNIIFAAPVKGMKQTLQSIGRVLRLHTSKKVAKLYDIGDNFSIGGYTNYAYKHFVQRIGYYVQEQFNHRIVRINL